MSSNVATVSLDSLHPMQERIRHEAARFNVINCGRRWGKTTLAADLVADTALDGDPAGWFAPTYKLLAEPWSEIKDVLAPVTASKNEQTKQIRLTTGGTIDFWTLDDPDAGRGRKYKRVIVDEAAKARHLGEAWQKAIRPTLADLVGDAWFFSTPRGRDFFWQLYCLGQDPLNAEWRSWSMPTLTNPFILPSEIEAARLELPERVFEQEFLATFLENAGGVFRKVAEAVDKGRAANEPPEEGRAYAMGVDLARVEDFTVLDVFDSTGRQVYHERFNQISWERQEAAIRAVSDRYKAPLYLDSTGLGDPIYERLRKAGCRVKPFGFTNASKEALIDALAMKVEKGEVRLLDVPVQTAELQAYQYKLTPSRNVRMNAPEGMHDDCVIALALAAWGLSRPRQGIVLPLEDA